MIRGGFVWLTLVLAAGLAFGQGTKETRQATQLFAQGIQLYEKQEYERAIELITKAIILAPNEAKYYYWRAYAYYWLNDGPRWEADLLRAVELDPSNSVYHTMLAVVYFEKDDYPRAIREYEVALDLDPNNWAAMRSVLDLYTEVGRYQEAIQLLETIPQRAIEQRYLDRDVDFILQMYAVAYEGLGQNEKAAEYRRKLSE